MTYILSFGCLFSFLASLYPHKFVLPHSIIPFIQCIPFCFSELHCFGCYPFKLKKFVGDDLAKVFGWKSRWCVALDIGGSLRYLHEECVDGPIVHLSVCSAYVVNTQGNSAMVSTKFNLHKNFGFSNSHLLSI